MLHNDEPTLVDKLARKKFVTQIVEAAVKCNPPQVFGVHGDWGAGKTSTLEAVFYHLSGKTHCKFDVPLETFKTYSNVLTIWFDAWQYQNEPVPIVALIQEMRKQLSKFGKIKAESGKIAEVTLRSILYGIDNIAKLISFEAAPCSPEKVQAIGEKWEKEHLADCLAADTIQKYLEAAISELLPRSRPNLPPPRLVIIIDDIDRCSAITAYRLLEGLRNYMVLPNCVFIIGMNQQIVTEAICSGMGKSTIEGDGKLRAEAYIEKMCSNIWRLPLPKSPSKFLLEFLTSEAKVLGDAIIAEEDKLKLSVMPPNPRRLKALANLLNRMWPKIKRHTAMVHEKILAAVVVAYVYQFHSEMYHRWQYDSNFLEVITEWVATASYNDAHRSCLSGLMLPTKAITSDQVEAPVVRCIGTYPDPTAPGIFWVAPLLQKTLRHLTPVDYDPLLKFEDSL